MWWTSDRIAHALNYLVSAGGLTPVGAAGLVARWAYVEAGAGPTAINPYSGAFGIAQWLGVRLPPIRGNTSFDAQLAYAVRELNSTEARAGSILRSAMTADQAAVGASTFERAEGYNPTTGRDNFTNRTASYVNSVLAHFNGGSSINSVVNSNPVVDPFVAYDDFIDLSNPVGVGGAAVGALAIGVVAFLVAYVVLSD